MSDSSNNKNIIVFTAIIAVALIIGGWVYYNSTKQETVSMKIGDKEISATFER